VVRQGTGGTGDGNCIGGVAAGTVVSLSVEAAQEWDPGPQLCTPKDRTMIGAFLSTLTLSGIVLILD
jgi:hypothetical protein